jgi:hypothetical protein
MIIQKLPADKQWISAKKTSRASRLLHSALSEANRDAQVKSQGSGNFYKNDQTNLINLLLLLLERSHSRSTGERQQRPRQDTPSPRGADRSQRRERDRTDSPSRLSSGKGVTFTVNLGDARSVAVVECSMYLPHRIGPRTNTSFKQPAGSKRGRSATMDEQQKEAIRSNALESTDTRLKRCTFWPQCAKGTDCPFHHPSELCP